MARSYREVLRDQPMLLAPDIRSWLPEDHLVWFVIEAVDRLDTTAFHARARRGGVGRKGYDPDMILMLFVYAMAHGISSTRKIESACHTDVAFRVICAQDIPDHTVLARFRQHHEQALTGLLGQSLELAAELGMVELGVVALDGTKISANASRGATMSEQHLKALKTETARGERFQQLAADYVHDSDCTDAAEDASGHDDDVLPPGLADRTGRAGRIDQALQQIDRRREGHQQRMRERRQHVEERQRASVEEGEPSAGRWGRGTDRVAMAKARWLRERDKRQARHDTAAAEIAAGTRHPRHKVKPADEFWQVIEFHEKYLDEVARAERERAQDPPPPLAREREGKNLGRANLTDPESMWMSTRQGSIQGYNVQTGASEDGFILLARATNDPTDVGQLVPSFSELSMISDRLGQASGRDMSVGITLWDAGYDSDKNLTVPGPDRLIADGKSRTLQKRAATTPATGRPPVGATVREVMNHRLRTQEGMSLYRLRSHTIEAPHGWLKDRRGLRQFARRGLEAVQSEVSLAAAVTNLLRIRALRGSTRALPVAG